VLATATVVAVEAWGNAYGRIGVAGAALAPALRASCSSGRAASSSSPARSRRPPGPHPGDSAEIERFWNLLDAVYIHVRATAAFGICFLLLLVWLYRNRDRRGVLLPAPPSCSACCSSQMAVGELQWRNQLPWWLVLIHVALAALVWACTVALVTALWRTPRRLT
jgi:heme A synthase